MSDRRVPVIKRIERVERALWRGQPVDATELAEAERLCHRIIDGPDRGRTLRNLAITVLGRIARLPPATD